MQHLYDTLISHEDPIRDIIGPFMVKPCKKAFPQYYKVIKNPIDMETINKRIKSNFYKSLDQFTADVKLMFENCKQYNDPASILYQDACDLLKIFNKVRNLHRLISTFMSVCSSVRLVSVTLHHFFMIVVSGARCYS